MSGPHPVKGGGRLLLKLHHLLLVPRLPGPAPGGRDRLKRVARAVVVDALLVARLLVGGGQFFSEVAPRRALADLGLAPGVVVDAAYLHHCARLVRRSAAEVRWLAAQQAAACGDRRGSLRRASLLRCSASCSTSQASCEGTGNRSETACAETRHDRGRGAAECRILQLRENNARRIEQADCVHGQALRGRQRGRSARRAWGGCEARQRNKVFCHLNQPWQLGGAARGPHRNPNINPPPRLPAWAAASTASTAMATHVPSGGAGPVDGEGAEGVGGPRQSRAASRLPGPGPPPSGPPLPRDGAITRQRSNPLHTAPPGPRCRPRPPARQRA